MANQYADSFIHIAPKKFGKSAEKLLREFEKDDKNYTEVAEITGFKENTIRKWCHHYGIRLKSLSPPKDKEVDGIDKINLKSKEVDVINFLYRKWQPIPKTNQNLAGL